MASSIPVRYIDIGHPIRQTEIEGVGHRWLVYWLVGDEDQVCVMSDGAAYVTVANPHELQELQAEAYALLDDRIAAFDLGCERMKRLLRLRGQWREL